MNLRIVILEAKKLADGSHKIRIAISHNAQTRYFPTRFVVPSAKNLKNGVVVGVDNAAYINHQLRSQVNKIYMICDEIEDVEYYSCSQLVTMINNKLEKGRIRTFEEIAGEMINIKKRDWAPDTVRLHEDSIKKFIEFAGKNFMLSMLDSSMVYDFRDFLRSKGYSETTVAMKISTLRRIVYFAVNHGYAKYEIPPFFDYKEPHPIVRDIALTLEQLRQIRDVQIDHKWTECARDLFMLSFYMCGMNLGDILAQDLTKDSVKFIRIKTKSRRNPNEFTEFTVQPEARAIINKYMVDGKLQFYGRSAKKSIQHITDGYISQLRQLVGIDKMIYYSARKTFAQLSNELMIKDSVIEYCLGDAISNPRRALSFYIKVNKRMADKAIRKVFDAVASDKSLIQLIEEETEK